MLGLLLTAWILAWLIVDSGSGPVMLTVEMKDGWRVGHGE